MIPLEKHPEPQILAQSSDKWTSEYLKHVTNQTEPPASLVQKYKLPEVKDVIKNETHEKCAYCESKITHVYPGDVEHILPKSKRPDLIFKWDNLTLACFDCNNSKRDYYNENEPLLNPYVDDPEHYFTFHGPLCVHHPGNIRGQLTRETIRLNRPSLFERRKERLEGILPLIDRSTEKAGTQLGQLLNDELMSEANPDKEYSLMVKHFLKAHLSTQT